MMRADNNSTNDPRSRRFGVCAYTCTILSLILLAAGTSQAARGQSTAEEYQVKAAFLFHFAQLVDWPDGALDTHDRVLNLCVLDDDPHHQEFSSTLNGKPIGDRVFQVRVLDQRPDFRGCNILFLSRGETRRQGAILKSVRGLPILTVGEADEFLSDGGMIRFHLEGDRIRFDIDVAASQSVHLRISARLLLLASSVMRSGAASGGA
jgi:hypothetical protein